MAINWKKGKEIAWQKLKHAFNIIMPAIASIFLSLVPFFFFYKYIPPIYVPFTTEQRIDHFLIFLIIFLVVFFLLRKIRKILYISIALGFLTLAITHVANIYRFGDLYHNYKTFLFNLREGAIRFQFEKYEPSDFDNEEPFRAAVNYKDSDVRDFAVNLAVMNFDEYEFRGNLRTAVQCFSVFKEIRSRWRYVYDPAGEDYWSRASETIKLLKSDGKFKGDCDDYSILMAACIRAIGGEVRLVRTSLKDDSGNEINHVYPEVKVGTEKDLEDINYLIKQVLFPKENKGEDIYFHVEENGDVWLNFDYNDYYPGGKYQSTKRIATLEI